MADYSIFMSFYEWGSNKQISVKKTINELIDNRNIEMKLFSNRLLLFTIFFFIDVFLFHIFMQYLSIVLSLVLVKLSKIKYSKIEKLSKRFVHRLNALLESWRYSSANLVQAIGTTSSKLQLLSKSL